MSTDLCYFFSIMAATNTRSARSEDGQEKHARIHLDVDGLALAEDALQVGIVDDHGGAVFEGDVTAEFVTSHIYQ